MSKVQVQLVPLKEAAQRLAVSEFTLRRMIANKEIKAVQRAHGSRVLLDVRDLEKWVESHKQ